MIVLDTNVVSEPLRSNPDQVVVDWLDAQAVETLYLPAISLAELRFGVEALPDGRRKFALGARLEDLVAELFEGRILDFDRYAASAYAQLRAEAKRRGHGIGDMDALIAAIAKANDCLVATRDATPFLTVGLKVINPWLGEAIPIEPAN